MAQQRLGGGEAKPESGSDTASEDATADSYDHIKYLDVDRLKYIKALAATLDTVAEVETYIEAEEMRWDRENVLRILNARKEALETSSCTGPGSAERVFKQTSQRASS